MDKFNTSSYSRAMPPKDIPMDMPMNMPMMRISDSDQLGQLPLAMAYVPMQQWGETYSADVALTKGTIFPELDLPFTGGKGGML